jgi:hypothetical protein
MILHHPGKRISFFRVIHERQHMKPQYERKYKVINQAGPVKYGPEFRCSGMATGVTIMSKLHIVNECATECGDNIGAGIEGAAPAASSDDDDDDSGDSDGEPARPRPPSPEKEKAAPSGNGAAHKENQTSSNHTISARIRDSENAIFASAYAAMGLRPIELHINKKTPKSPGWQNTPALLPEQVREKFKLFPGNLGCTFPPELFALDVDCKAGKQGFESLAALEDINGHLPPTLTQRTPSGGEHRIFRKPPSTLVGNPVDFLPGLDVGYFCPKPRKGKN